MDLSLNLGTFLIVLGVLVVVLSVHEASHALAALKLGDRTAYEYGRVSFNPLRHIDPFATVLLPMITLILFQVPLLAAKPVPFNPDRVKYDEFGAAIIGFAGPASNLLMAMTGALLYKFVPGGTFFSDVVSIFVLINIGVFVFNMIPIPPLDGSRVLYAFAPETLQDFMRQIEPYGFFIVFGLVLAVPGFTDLLINLNELALKLLP